MAEEQIIFTIHPIVLKKHMLLSTILIHHGEKRQNSLMTVTDGQTNATQ